MSDMNHVFLSGNLTKDPFINDTNAKFTIATKVWSFKDKKTITKYINVVAFGSAKTYVEKFGRKGLFIQTFGNLESYKDDKRDLWVLSYVAREVTIINQVKSNSTDFNYGNNAGNARSEAETLETQTDEPMEELDA